MVALIRGNNMEVVKFLVENGANLTGSFIYVFYNEDWEDKGLFV